MKINDKHIEVIVRQMLQKVEITESGDTTLLVGEQVDRQEMNEINAKLDARSRSRPKASRCCSASPRRACRPAASSRPPRSRRRPGCSPRLRSQGKIDTLDGLKENVIVGRLIPAGTGAGMNRMRIAATSRDAALRAQQRKLQEALIAANSAAEEHAAELAQGPEAAIGDDPLAAVRRRGHGTDADAGEYLQQSDETLEAPEATEEVTEEEAAPEEE